MARGGGVAGGVLGRWSSGGRWRRHTPAEETGGEGALAAARDLNAADFWWRSADIQKSANIQ